MQNLRDAAKRTEKKERKKERKREREKKKNEKTKKTERARRMTPSDFFDATEFLVSNNDELERAQVELSLNMLIHAVELRAATESTEKKMDTTSSSKKTEAGPSLLKFIQLEENVVELQMENDRLVCKNVLERLLGETVSAAAAAAPAAAASATAAEPTSATASDDVNKMIEGEKDDVKVELTVQKSIDNIITTIQLNDAYEQQKKMLINQLEEQQRQHNEVIEMKEAVIEEFTNHIIRQQEAEERKLLLEDNKEQEKSDEEVKLVLEKLVSQVVAEERISILENALSGKQKIAEEAQKKLGELECALTEEQHKVKEATDREKEAHAMIDEEQRSAKVNVDEAHAKVEEEKRATEKKVESLQNLVNEEQRKAVEAEKKLNEEQRRTREMQTKIDEEKVSVVIDLFFDDETDFQQHLKMLAHKNLQRVQFQKEAIATSIECAQVAKLVINDVIFEIERRESHQKLLVSNKKRERLQEDVEELTNEIGVLRTKSQKTLENLLEMESEKEETREKVKMELEETFSKVLEEKSAEKEKEKHELRGELREEKELLLKEHESIKKELEGRLKNAELTHEAAIREEGKLVKGAIEESFHLKNELKVKEMELEENNKMAEVIKRESEELKLQVADMKEKSELKATFENIKEQLIGANANAVKQKEDFLGRLKEEEMLRGRLEEVSAERGSNARFKRGMCRGVFHFSCKKSILINHPLHLINHAGTEEAKNGDGANSH